MGGVGAVSGGGAGPGNSAPPFSPKLLTFVLDGKAPLPQAGEAQGSSSR